MPKHLFTMTTDGDIMDQFGNVVARLSDDSHISDFLIGVRAGFDLNCKAIDGEIIREGDYQAWETAAVKRMTGGRLKNTGRLVTPQVPAIPGTSPMGFKLPKTCETHSGRRSI